jgi:hypothetical protein
MVTYALPFRGGDGSDGVPVRENEAEIATGWIA